METIYLRILLAMVLILLCVPLSFSYVAPKGSTGTCVPVKEAAQTAVLGQSFQIKYGQELTVKGQDLKVKFGSLVEDSRCPRDVKCIWAGDAKILITVRRANAVAANIEVHTSPSFKQAGKYQRYVIKLVALDPYPNTREEKKPADYVATLLITKE
jgi:hypothetical protein